MKTLLLKFPRRKSKIVRVPKGTKNFVLTNLGEHSVNVWLGRILWLVLQPQYDATNNLMPKGPLRFSPRKAGAVVSVLFHP